MTDDLDQLCRSLEQRIKQFEKQVMTARKITAVAVARNGKG